MKNLLLLASGVATLLAPSLALAHVSLAGPGYAGTSQVLTFSVGHGCEGADTYKVEVAIPSEVTSVRALPSLLGEATLTKSAAGTVTAVAFGKATVRDADDQYYQFSIRIGVPDLPFKKLYFSATQYCRNKDGVESTVAWAATAEQVAADPNLEPAPSLMILPKRRTGWNKVVVGSQLNDLKVFDDAQIVWVGSAAYSANPDTMALITSTSDVEVLSVIDAGAEVWVKY